MAKKKKRRKNTKTKKKIKRTKKFKKKVKNTKRSRKKTRRSKKSKKRSIKTKKSSRGQVFKKQYFSKDSDGNSIIKVSDNWANHAYVNSSKYKKKYKLSIKENEKFWAKEGKRISWIKKYTKIKDIKYSKEEVKIKWYYDGTLNASANWY